MSTKPPPGPDNPADPMPEGPPRIAAGAGEPWDAGLMPEPWEPGPWDADWPGPGGLPADPDAEWLASLPDSDVAVPWTGEGEATAAGFEHRSGGVSGFGFAAGGSLDLMEPGPVLAGFLADAVAGGVPGGAVLIGPDGNQRPLIGQGNGDAGMAALGESELIGVLCASRRMASLAAAQELEAVAILARRRTVQAAERKRPSLAEHVVGEVAAALCLTGRAAGRLLEISGNLARLPAVGAALVVGLIDRDRAVVVGDELAALSDQDARAAAGRILDRAPGLTTGQLRDALRKIVLSIDPDAVRRRREKARKDASVQLWEEPSGNTALAGRELSRARAVAADARLTAYARWLQARGAEGTLDQLRAAVFVAMLSDQPIETLLPAPPGASDCPAAPDGSPAAPDGGHSPAGSDGHSCAPAGPGALGGTSGTGDATGSPAPASRRGSNGDGALLGGLPPGLGLPGGGSWRPAVTGSINLTVPLSAWLGQSDAPGEVGGHGAADADTCRDIAAWLAADDRTRWCVTFTDADGRAAAHACARHGPPPPPPPPDPADHPDQPDRPAPPTRPARLARPPQPAPPTRPARLARPPQPDRPAPPTPPARLARPAHPDRPDRPAPSVHRVPLTHGMPVVRPDRPPPPAHGMPVVRPDRPPPRARRAPPDRLAQPVRPADPRRTQPGRRHLPALLARHLRVAAHPGRPRRHARLPAGR